MRYHLQLDKSKVRERAVRLALGLTMLSAVLLQAQTESTKASSFSKAVAQGLPRVVETQNPSSLVPIVSYVVTDAPYLADKTGKTDCTKAFERALADADKKGGTVFAPAGRYLFDGKLVIPAGITLRGDWKRPSEKDSKVEGTVLLVTAGHGNSGGDPFIKLSGGSIRDLNIFYPKQDVKAVVPYPLTVDVEGGGTVKNLTLVNPYRALRSHSFSSIFDIYMCPLKNGITALHAAAVPRCRKVSMSPLYWAGSGLANAPRLTEIRKALQGQNACGIQLHRQDGGMYTNILIEDYPTGVKFMPPHGWTYWHGLETCNVGVGVHFAGGARHGASFTRCNISAQRHAVLVQMDKTGWAGNEAGWRKLSKNPRAFGTSKDSAELYFLGTTLRSGQSAIFMDGSLKSEINAQHCIFAGWGDAADDFAIQSTTGIRKGSVVVYDSKFVGGKRHIKVSGSTAKLHVVGNTFSGPPDLQLDKSDDEKVDHSPYKMPIRFESTLHPVPQTLPAKTGPDAFFPVSAPNTGVGDATKAIRTALAQADKHGGGTVYLPQGTFRVTDHLHVPPGVELRGVNDTMPRQYQIRTIILADLPQDAGKPDNPPFITLGSDAKRGGSGISGLCLLYANQDWKQFRPYPWAVQSQGPGCWVRRINMGNLYNGFDFASNNSDKHVISRVNGSALNTAIRVGKTPTMGWIDFCQIRPQDWLCSNAENLPVPHPGEHPPRSDVARGEQYSLVPNMRGAAAIVIDSGANEQIHGVFANGATRFIDLVDHDGSGGGNATLIACGSEAGWGAEIKALGEKGVTFVGCSFNPQTRLPYVKPDDIPEGQLPKGMVMRIGPSVGRDGPINFIGSHYLTRAEIKTCFDLQGGCFFMLQSYQDIGMADGIAFDIRGGRLIQRNARSGKIREQKRDR